MSTVEEEDLDMCNVTFNISTAMQYDILSALSTMTCAMCNETCPPWKDRSQAINVPPQMHQQHTKGRKYGAIVLLGIWQQQKDQVL